MKSWQIFVAGAAAVIASLLLPLYEPVIAGLAALAVVVVVGLGFFLHPRRDIFYVRTTVRRFDLDGNLCLEHDQLAVRVELARLRLLFLPTSLAVTFLVVTTANGTLWRFSLLARMFAGEPSYLLLIILRLALPLAAAALWAWITERWVLRDADACNADSVTVGNGWVSFAFVDRRGETYAGECPKYGLARPPLATLVFYDVLKPERNRIGMGFLFHRLVIVGRGLTDLDQETVTAYTVVAGTAPSARVSKSPVSENPVSRDLATTARMGSSGRY